MKDVKTVMNIGYFEEYEMSDLDERRLFINGVIDDEIIDTIVYHILRYNREDKGIPVNDRLPIKIYINSTGGDVYSGYGLISAITSSITPIYTINQGTCASMAFLIFIASNKRYSMENSMFLMHEGFTGGFDNTSKMRDRMEFETEQLEEHTRNFVLNHTSIKEDFYKKKYRIEWYMLPEEAKRYGICDYIVGKDCTIDEIV